MFGEEDFSKMSVTSEQEIKDGNANRDLKKVALYMLY